MLRRSGGSVVEKCCREVLRRSVVEKCSEGVLGRSVGKEW